jgi:hypothetical protein
LEGKTPATHKRHLASTDVEGIELINVTRKMHKNKYKTVNTKLLILLEIGVHFLYIYWLFCRNRTIVSAGRSHQGLEKQQTYGHRF